MYFANFDDYDRYKAETAHHVSYRVVDVLGNAYIVTIPQLVLDVATVAAQGANQSVKARYSWSANNSDRSEEHTSELQSLMRISYAVFSLTKKKTIPNKTK